MHDEISLAFIQNVCLSKVCLSNSTFINGWMSNWFFNWGSVPPLGHNSWCCWWCNCSCLVSECGTVWASSFRNWWDNLSLWFNWSLEGGRDLSVFSTRWLIVADNSCSFFNSVRGKSFSFKLLQPSLQISALRVSFNILFPHKRSIWFLGWDIGLLYFLSQLILTVSCVFKLFLTKFQLLINFRQFSFFFLSSTFLIQIFLLKKIKHLSVLNWRVLFAGGFNFLILKLEVCFFKFLFKFEWFLLFCRKFFIYWCILTLQWVYLSLKFGLAFNFIIAFFAYFDLQLLYFLRACFFLPFQIMNLFLLLFLSFFELSNLLV